MAPTTRKSADTTPAPPAADPVQTPAAAEAKPVAVTAPAAPVDPFPDVLASPGAVVATAPPTLPGDEPPVSARDAALAGLLAAPVVVDIDRAPRPAPRQVQPTGNQYPWQADGTWFLVGSSLYPRVIDDVRLQARRGDMVQVRVDDRTQTDLASGYLIAVQ